MNDGGFVDRLEAGHLLAQSLQRYRGTDAVLLGLARGGVAVAYAVAEDLSLPLQALVVRKVGAPHNEELAIGAVSETGVEWLDKGMIQALGVTDSYLRHEVQRQVAEARRRQEEYRIGPGLEIVRGRPAIVVDDGIATGASALVGVMSARDLGASEVVVATPVASGQAVQMLRSVADEVVALGVYDPFWAVGIYYRHFDQVTDQEVREYLQQANARQESRS